MIYTLLELKENQFYGIDLEIDYKKELKNLDIIEDIDICYVKGTYKFLYSTYLEFSLDVSVELTYLTSDTLKEKKYKLEFHLDDEVSDTSETEYKIIDNKVDIYELVWGWLAAEMPLHIYEN
ncbi:MAG: hypothetical protein GX931_04435 [Acholeplasmataceae bacterium]|jgi:hypothetical protein|nr:hypothetical protein [Acholeplasmataceae bacterium]